MQPNSNIFFKTQTPIIPTHLFLLINFLSISSLLSPLVFLFSLLHLLPLSSVLTSLLLRPTQPMTSNLNISVRSRRDPSFPGTEEDVIRERKAHIHGQLCHPTQPMNMHGENMDRRIFLTPSIPGATLDALGSTSKVVRL